MLVTLKVPDGVTYPHTMRPVPVIPICGAGITKAMRRAGGALS